MTKIRAMAKGSLTTSSNRAGSARSSAPVVRQTSMAGAYTCIALVARAPSSTLRTLAPVSARSVPRLRSGRKQHAGRIRDFDLDLQRRDALAAIHPHLNVLVLDRNMLGERGQNVFSQNGEEVGLATRRPFVGQEDLKPFARDRGGTATPEQVEDVHAAPRPNSLSSRPLRSLGMLIGTSSPLSLRAASI